ncbi:MAG: carboxymuconolactone decarboxylase family protein [Phycisphaerales bacterium]|nr:MAG: carboxymuconolactone decarboxylase family protein [Phycisphaerales bacterium]
MPRLSLIDPANNTGPGADMLNGPLKDKQINIFKGLAVNPTVLKAFLEYMQNIKSGELTDQEHEIIALVASEKNQCDYCTAAHTQIAKGTGLNEDDTLNIRRGESSDARQQALIDFVTAVLETNGFVTDDQLEQFRNAGFTDAAVIEVVAGLSVITFTNLYNHINETEVDFPVPAGA